MVGESKGASAWYGKAPKIEKKPLAKKKSLVVVKEGKKGGEVTKPLSEWFKNAENFYGEGPKLAQTYREMIKSIATLVDNGDDDEEGQGSGGAMARAAHLGAGDVHSDSISDEDDILIVDGDGLESRCRAPPTGGGTARQAKPPRYPPGGVPEQANGKGGGASSSSSSGRGAVSTGKGWGAAMQAAQAPASALPRARGSLLEDGEWGAEEEEDGEVGRDAEADRDAKIMWKKMNRQVMKYTRLCLVCVFLVRNFALNASHT